MNNTANTGEAILPRGEFRLSAGWYRDLPPAAGAEYCVIGRSNVGKSSFINHALGSRHLAHVSRTPGKTVCINLFQISNGTVWADLPGYGYAKAPREQKGRISTLIREYCENRTSLQGILWLLDIRHPGMKADIEAFGWLGDLGIPVLPVLTKCDKLSKGQADGQERRYRALFPIGFTAVRYSIEMRESRERFWQAYESWVRTTRRVG